MADLRWEADGSYHVPNQPLKGRAVTVFGGGPSLTPDVVTALEPFPNIAVNNAFLLMTAPTLFVALDRRYYEWHGHALAQSGHTVVTALRENVKLNYRHPHFVMRAHREAALDMTPGVISGQNSGHGAVSLAVHLGATRIFLVGFDMGFVGGKSHWHVGHVIPSSEANYVTRFRPKLEKCVVMAAELGVHVASVTDTMAAIPRISLEDALKDLTDDQNRLDNPEA